MTDKESLEFQIHGQNELNRVIAEIVNDYMPKIKSFIGKKIGTLKGLSSKFNEVKPLRIDPKPYKKGIGKLHILYIDISGRDLFIKVSICLNGGDYDKKTNYCRYFNKDVYIGKLENDVLIELNLDKYEYTPIVLSEELEKIERFQQLEKELNLIEYAIKVPQSFYK